MDGRWGTGAVDRREEIQQAAFNRFRILRVNTIVAGVNDASGFAALAPNVAPLNVDPDGGPHFILSPETGDQRPTLGFEWGLLSIGGATPVAPGFDVTIWRLVTTTMQPTITKQWLAFETLVGVGYDELFHSFDMNTGALRFQIDNVNADGGIVIALAEL